MNTPSTTTPATWPAVSPARALLKKLRDEFLQKRGVVLDMEAFRTKELALTTRIVQLKTSLDTKSKEMVLILIYLIYLFK